MRPLLGGRFLHGSFALALAFVLQKTRSSAIGLIVDLRKRPKTLLEVES